MIIFYSFDLSYAERFLFNYKGNEDNIIDLNYERRAKKIYDDGSGYI